eukprot:14523999-Heterocapsa_arctica.AAC.1
MRMLKDPRKTCFVKETDKIQGTAHGQVAFIYYRLLLFGHEISINSPLLLACSQHHRSSAGGAESAARRREATT